MESIPEANGVITVNIANSFGVNRAHDKNKSSKSSIKFGSTTKGIEVPPEQAIQMIEKSSKPLKKIKKGIFISYSPDAGFKERAFVSDLVRQLKENNMADDIWFDKDESCMDSPIWFSQRMEAAEKCQAAILVLSDTYFTCPVSVYEARTLYIRQETDQQSVTVFSILYSELVKTEIPAHYHQKLLPDTVDLTLPALRKLSVAEKTSVVLSSVMENLEKFAVINTPPSTIDDVEPQFNGEYKEKKICQWTVSNLQEWLHSLGVKEFYRQSLAERMVDGFLLMSMTDDDMVNHLGIDSRIVRKKIMQHILVYLEKEQKLADSWHLRARSVRAKPATLYLIYDPADVRLAQTFKTDLGKKGFQVIHHQKLGQSKEEFLHLNGPFMATCSHILLVLTEHATNSPFVYHEMLFADWLGKKILVACFKNDWGNLRPSMKSVIGECLAVDFERKLYSDGMDVLEHHLKPVRTLPGVVLEQSFLNKMSEGLRPLAQIASANTDLVALHHSRGEASPHIFISFQWDMHSKVEDMKIMFQNNGIECWADTGAHMRGRSSLSTRSSTSHSSASHDSQHNLQSIILRNMKAASLVICCITPKYIQSDNCQNDLKLAESLEKPIIALLLRFCSWPPDGASQGTKKTLSKCVDVIEMYNDKLYKQNLARVLERVRRAMAVL